VRMVYRQPSIGNALRLKGFIFGDQPMLFGTEHPLGPAFRSLHKMLTAPGDLTAADENLVADLDLKAEAIMALAAKHCRPYELKRDLRHSESCGPLLFEASVLKFVIEQKVRSVTWRRYEEGVSDFITEGPPLQVECKLVTGHVTVERLLKRAFRNSHQGRAGEGAFVLVAGAREPIELSDQVHAVTWINNHAGEWFRRHRSVAFVVLVLPMTAPSDAVVTRLGAQGTLFDVGRVIALRSEVANERAPIGFHFTA
jgi:hypothetical protein